ncbi:hypothetical protein [Terricaulis sp.]|uniref:hypothetical protein n=1 Tax=Terricaulis sp. TaxID=2768686 RepID=UPI0037842C82
MNAHVTSHRIAERPNAGGTLRLLALLLLVWAILAGASLLAPYLDNFAEKAAPTPVVIAPPHAAPEHAIAPPAAALTPPARPARPHAPERTGVPLDAPHATAAAEEFDVLSAAELDAISQDRSTAP